MWVVLWRQAADRRRARADAARAPRCRRGEKRARCRRVRSGWACWGEGLLAGRFRFDHVRCAGLDADAEAKILQFLQDLGTQRQAGDDVTVAERLSEDAAAELSRAMVEDLGGREETEAYNDSLRVLRKAYLNMLYMEHSRKAEEYLKAGDTAYIQELNEVKNIKDEMDEL